MKKILLTSIIFISALSIAYSQCTKPTVVTITTPVTSPITICQGTALTLSGSVIVANAPANGTFTYSWIKIAPVGLIIVAPTTINIPANTSTAIPSYTGITGAVTDAGIYALRVEDGDIGNSGCYTEATVVINVNPLPTITGTLTVCNGSTTQLTGSGTGDTTAPWTSATTSVATVSTTGVVTGVSPGTSVITYKNNAGCTQSATVTVNPLPTITGTLNVCDGSTNLLTGSGIGQPTATWYSATTAVATVSTTGVVTGVSPGTSVITYKNNNGCTQSATVTVNPLPTITGTLNICNGSTIQLTGSGIGDAIIPWTSATTAVATVTTTGIVIGVSPGTSVITYKNNTGCTRTATVTVITEAIPTVSVSVSPGTTICPGTSVLFKASPTNGGTIPTYQWIKNGAAIIGETSSTYATTSSENGDNISVQMTSNLSCAMPLVVTSNAVTMTVTSSVTPSVAITADKTSICENSDVITFTATPTNGGPAPAYEWFINKASQGPPDQSNVFTPYTLSPANNTVEVHMTSNAICASPTSVSSISLSIAISTGISAGIIGSDQTICYGSIPAPFTELTATNASSPVYTWEAATSAAGPWVIIPGVWGSTFGSSTGLSEDIYIRRVVTDASIPAPCNAATSNVVHITVLPALEAGTISSDETICEGTTPSTITETASPIGGTGTYTYRWESSSQSGGPYSAISNETNSSYSPGVLNYTMYFKRIATSGLCGSASSNEVAKTVASTILSTITIDDPGPTCDGDIVLFKCKATNVGLTPAYNWYVNNNIAFSNSPTFTSNNSFAPLKNGDEVWVELISSSSCTNSSTITSNKIIVDLTPCTVSNSIYTTSNIDILLQQYVSNSIPNTIDYTYFWSITDSSITTTVITGPNPISPGQQNAVYNVPNQAGYTYTWSIIGGTIVSGQNTNAITVDWDGTAPIAMARTTVPSYSISVTETNPANEAKTTSMTINTTTTAVALPLAESGIQFYPNPSVDAFNIVMPESGTLVNYSISDLTGTTVANGSFTSSGGAEKIATDFHAGLYQVVLKYNGTTTCMRLNKVQ